MIATDIAERRAIAPFERVIGDRTRWLAIAVTAIGAGLVSVRTAQAELGFSYLAESAAGEVVGLAAGWGLVAVGLETLRRGRHAHLGLLLAIAGVAWFLADWSDPASGSPLVFTQTNTPSGDRTRVTSPGNKNELISTTAAAEPSRIGRLAPSAWTR